VPQDLGALPGGSNSRARDIDSSDVVVGTSDIANGNRAFIWSSDTGIQDLNQYSSDPSIVLIDALSINKKGEILALGIYKSDFPTDDGDSEEHELPRQIVLLTPQK
jgi:probable HAF family extracellular repeat protein